METTFRWAKTIGSIDVSGLIEYGKLVSIFVKYFIYCCYLHMYIYKGIFALFVRVDI